MKNPILMAAARGDHELTALLLDHEINPKPDVDERDESGVTALGWLLRKADRGCGGMAVTALISAGASCDTEAADDDGETKRMRPLAWWAVCRGEAVGGPVLDAVGDHALKKLSDEHPLLHKAAGHGWTWSVRRLLKAGADPNRMDGDAGRPAENAASEEILRDLLKAGALVSENGSGGKKVSVILTSKGLSWRSLLDAGMREGGAASVMDVFFAAVEKKDRNTARRSISKAGKDGLEARDDKGRTPLIAAIDAGLTCIAMLLLDNGANPRAMDDKGRWPTLAMMVSNPDRREKDRDAGRVRLFERLGGTAGFRSPDEKGWSAAEILWSQDKSAWDWMSTELKNALWKGFGDDFFTKKGPGERTFLEAACMLWKSREGEFFWAEAGGSTSGRSFEELLIRVAGMPGLDKTASDMVINTLLGEKSDSSWTASRARQRNDTARGGNLRTAVRLLLEKHGAPDGFVHAPGMAESDPGMFAMLESAGLSDVTAGSRAAKRKRTL